MVIGRVLCVVDVVTYVSPVPLSPSSLPRPWSFCPQLIRPTCPCRSCRRRSALRASRQRHRQRRPRGRALSSGGQSIPNINCTMISSFCYHPYLSTSSSSPVSSSQNAHLKVGVARPPKHCTRRRRHRPLS